MAPAHLRQSRQWQRFIFSALGMVYLCRPQLQDPVTLGRVFGSESSLKRSMVLEVHVECGGYDCDGDGLALRSWDIASICMICGPP